MQNGSVKDSFLQYVMKVFPAVIILAAAMMMAHGSILFTDRIGVDTEFMMYGNQVFDQVGRQGLVWLADILELEWFNPYLVQVLVFVFMVLTPVLFGFLFHRCAGQEKLLNTTLIVLGICWIVSPFWTAQIYFFNQSAQITCSCALTALAILSAEEGRRTLGTFKTVYILFSIFLMQFIFSSYQILTMIYVAGVVMVFLCSSLKEKRSLTCQLRWILFHAGVFLAGFAAYLLIAKTFFYTDMGITYQSGQIKWNEGFQTGLHNCISAILSTLRSNPPFYTGWYGIFGLILLVAVIYKAVRNSWFREKKASLVIPFLAVLFLIATPYVFIVFYGGQLPGRVQLVLPFSQGCMLYLSVMILFGEKEPAVEKNHPVYRKWMRKAVAVILTAAVLKNMLTDMGYCNRLYYTDEWRYQYDRQIAHDIYMELRNYMAENSYDQSLYEKLIFLGYPLISYNEVAIKEDVVGNSLFVYDIGADDTSRTRITYFMKAMGYPIEPDPWFSEGARAAYYVYFEDYFGERVDAMPSFPEHGYIQYLESEEIGLQYLIVKLGPYWRSAIENPANH